MTDLKIFKEVDDLLDQLAEMICEASEKAIGERGQFNFVLSGGSSPQKLYKLLASERFKHRIDWDKVYFFFGDERFVPADDGQRNSLMAEQTLFNPLKIKKTNIFEVDTSGTPEESAQQYWDAVTKHFSGKPVEFDFILLGLGDNSHTASLFPDTPVLEEKEATIKSVFVAEVEMFRITMTAPLINKARHIAFLVFGKEKSEAVFHVLEDKSGSAYQYPGRLITSYEKKVLWFLDSSAASKL